MSPTGISSTCPKEANANARVKDYCVSAPTRPPERRRQVAKRSAAQRCAPVRCAPIALREMDHGTTNGPLHETLALAYPDVTQVRLPRVRCDTAQRSRCGCVVSLLSHVGT